jgi:hypothetical protein
MPADDSALDFASVLEAHITTDDAPARATLDTTALARRELQPQPKPKLSESDSPFSDAVAVETPASTEKPRQDPNEFSSLEPTSPEDNVVASKDSEGSADSDQSSVATEEAVIVQPIPAPLVLATPVETVSLAVTPIADVVTEAVTALSGLSAEGSEIASPRAAALVAPTAELPTAPLTNAVQSATSGQPNAMVAAAVVDLAVITEAPVAALLPVVDSFESTLQNAVADADKSGPLTASLVASPANADDQSAPPVAPQLSTLPAAPVATAQGTPTTQAGAGANQLPESSTLDVAADEPGSSTSPAASAQQLKGAVASSQATSVKDAAGVIQTDNIRSEVWEIAKRAQALSRVEAVIHTSQGELTVLARHGGSGVSVILGGTALESLDITALRNELPGLDVSVDQGKQEHRAPQDQQDTITPQAAQPALPTIRPISQSPQGLLDTHA